MIKKITLGLATFSLAAATFVTPAFAAKAVNKNVSGGSVAKAKAVEVTTTNLSVKNKDTDVTNVVVFVANSGGVLQLSGGDKNGVTTGNAIVNGVSAIEVNRTVFK